MAVPREAPIFLVVVLALTCEVVAASFRSVLPPYPSLPGCCIRFTKPRSTPAAIRGPRRRTFPRWPFDRDPAGSKRHQYIDVFGKQTATRGCTKRKRERERVSTKFNQRQDDRFLFRLGTGCMRRQNCTLNLSRLSRPNQTVV